MQETEKKLNLWNIIGLGLGGAIGTGIFLLLGYGIAYTGRSIVLVVVVGCFFMLLAYWYNLVMPSIFVLKGGDYSMKTMLFTPIWSGFNALLAVVGGFAMASYSVGIAQYLGIAVPALAQYEAVVAFIVTVLVFLSTWRGSYFVTILENLVTIVLVIALAMFVLFGIPQVDFASYFSNTNVDGPFFLNGFGGFVSAIAVMGWACQGTTMAPISMAAVTDKPKKTIPFAILIITVLLAVIYGAMAYVAGGVLPYAEAAGANISVTAEAILPGALYLFFVVGGGIGAILSSELGGLGMYRYPLMQIAEDGWIPAIFKKTDKNGYPYLTYIGYFIITVFPIVTGMSLDAIVSLVMIPSMLINIYMNLACISLPKKYPEQWAKRSLRIPVWFYNICCVLGAFCAGVVAYNLFVDLTMNDAIVCAVIVVVMFAVSYLRLKQGAVKVEDLAAKKEAIVKEALEAEE